LVDNLCGSSHNDERFLATHHVRGIATKESSRMSVGVSYPIAFDSSRSGSLSAALAESIAAHNSQPDKHCLYFGEDTVIVAGKIELLR
jgi:hypothetical protein